MASYTKEFLSGGTANGRNIKVVQTASAGTLIHTAHATAKDEMWLWATNTTTVDVPLTIEFGGTTSPDDQIIVTVPAKEKILICEGLVLSGALVIRAFAGTANVVNVNGYVNRIS